MANLTSLRATEPATAAPVHASDVPKWLGTPRYEVTRCIGRGGMGAVYEALDRERRIAVAVKRMLHFGPEALYRFKQEFRTLAGVRHPNLVRLHELVATDTDLVFFVMELVHGTDFQAYVRGRAAADRTKASSSPDLERLRFAMRQLANGVHAVHPPGMLH